MKTPSNSERSRSSVMALETLFARHPFGTCVLDGRLRVVYCNAAYRRAFSADEEAVGAYWPELVGLGPEQLERVQAAQKSGRAFTGAGVALRARGASGVTPWDLSVTPTENGGLLIMVGEASEVDRSAKAERTQLAAILENLDEVQRAYAELQHLDQRKAEFLNSVSHELRTPLTAIIGYAEFLDEAVAGTLNEAQRDYVAQILAGTDRILHLINDLLDFARLEAGAFRLDPAPVEYAELIARTVTAIEPLALRKRLSLSVKNSPEVPEVQADPERLAQILLNLLSNAIKFTPEGGRISVETSMQGDCVVTEVVDSGIGIASESLPQLFSQFYQVPGNADHGPSTGLGLAITKGLVEAHEGHISVESTLGSGTTFRFTLPVTREEPPGA